MKMSDGLREGTVVVGNAYDKYGSRNPIVRQIMKGFDRSLSELVVKAAPATIHEIGCGEGFWTLKWNQQGFSARGTDFSSKVIELARKNAVSQNFSPSIFDVQSIYELDFNRHQADLIICCEVLEHLEDPEMGLKMLQTIVSKYLIISVPREPVWRILNMMSGRYLTAFGNTPGHIQHWSKGQFTELIKQYFDVMEIKTPLPWTMLLCRTRI